MPTAPAPPEAAATPLHVAVRTLDAAALAAAGHTAAAPRGAGGAPPGGARPGPLASPHPLTP
ncbi:hypothetical protein M3D44_010580 [Micrococcus luteus]|nr:hypothetical protein [Micrococcus luteus]